MTGQDRGPRDRQLLVIVLNDPSSKVGVSDYPKQKTWTLCGFRGCCVAIGICSALAYA
jgi:hypothetical protein